MFKRSQPSLASEPVEYPSGVFIHTEKGYFYIVSQTKRYHIITKRILDSWSPHRVVETTEAAVSKYRIAAKMKFRNGSLIHNYGDGKMYLIVDAKRRHIESPDVLARIGAKRSEVVGVSRKEANLHEEGEPLS